MKTIRRTKNGKRRGFTLLEVLLVLAIIGVIAALAVPQLLGRQQDAMIDATTLKIKGFEDALKFYASGHDGRYPSEGSTETVVAELMNPKPLKNGRQPQPYLEAIPVDSWGNPLNYENPPSGNRQTSGGKPAVWSNGPDEQEGTDDDIGNWIQNL